MFRLLAGLTVALLMSINLAAAQSADTTLGDADQGAIRQVVESQIEAFQKDEWAAAFAYASPVVQQKFGDPTTFMEMVKSGYGPVYRPRQVTFGKVIDTQYGPDQIVQLIGPDGLAYTAHYTMERQPDGTWKISGCYLARGPDESV
jgi:hypothetical protein